MRFLSKALEKYIYCLSYSREHINWQETVLGLEEIKCFSTIQVRELKLILELFNYFPACLQFIKDINIDISRINECLSIVKRIEHPLFKVVLMDYVYEYNQCMKNEDIKQNIKRYPQEIVENYYQYCFLNQKIEDLNPLFLFKYFPRLLSFSF